MAEQKADPARELKQLVRQISVSEGFRFLELHQAEGWEDAEAALEHALGAKGVRLVRVPIPPPEPGNPDAVPLSHLLRDAYRQAEGPAAFSVSGLEPHAAGYDDKGEPVMVTDFIGLANFHRDILPDLCPAPVLFWIPVMLYRAYAVRAPDLWHWRAGSYDIGGALNRDWPDELPRVDPAAAVGLRR